jgi:hypothetical protein
MLTQTSYSKTYLNLMAVCWPKLYVQKPIQILCIFKFLIQMIYRGCRMGGAGVGAASPNRGCCAVAPYTTVLAPLPATIWGAPMEMLLVFCGCN